MSSDVAAAAGGDEAPDTAADDDEDEDDGVATAGASCGVDGAVAVVAAAAVGTATGAADTTGAGDKSAAACLAARRLNSDAAAVRERAHKCTNANCEPPLAAFNDASTALISRNTQFCSAAVISASSVGTARAASRSRLVPMHRIKCGWHALDTYDA